MSHPKKVFGVILLAGLAAYGNSFYNLFVYDDVGFIQNNPGIRSLKNLWLLWSSRYFEVAAGAASFRPISVTFWILSHAVFGNNPGGFRLISLLLHLAVTCLVYGVGCRLGLSLGAAGCAALLFAVHPVHSEAVHCIAFNGDLLSTLFALASLLSYLRAGSQILPAFFLGLALLSKEAALMLPPFLLVYETLWPGEDMNRKARRNSWVAIVCVTLLYLWIRFVALKSPMESTKSYLGGSLSSNLLTVSRLPLRYLLLWIFPLRLSAYHDVRVIQSWSDPGPWVHLAIWMLLAAGFYRLLRRDRLALLCSAWAILGIVPILNLLPFASLKTVFSERFLYLPSVGLCWLAARLGEDLGTRYQRPASLLVLMGVALLGWRVHLRNRDWKNDEALLSAALPIAPFTAGGILGSRHLVQGSYEEAAGELELALQAAPDEPNANWVRTDLSIALGGLGRHREAIALLWESHRKGDRSPQLYANLGTSYYRIKDFRSAAKHLEQAVAYDPDNSGFHFNLNLVYLPLNDFL